jgi:hypothetical protein
MIKKNNTKDNLLIRLIDSNIYIVVKAGENIKINEEYEVYKKITSSLKTINKVIKKRL